MPTPPINPVDRKSKTPRPAHTYRGARRNSLRVIQAKQLADKRAGEAAAR